MRTRSAGTYRLIFILLTWIALYLGKTGLSRILSKMHLIWYAQFEQLYVILFSASFFNIIYTLCWWGGSSLKIICVSSVLRHTNFKLNSRSHWLGKALSNSLNFHIISGWCMENLEELPFKCPNEQITAIVLCFINFFKLLPPHQQSIWTSHKILQKR